MVQCEMCGAETGSPKTIKVEGAELEVCDDCADFGTEVTTQQSSSGSSKYSTSSSSGSGASGTSSGGGNTGGGGGGSSRRRRDMFDEMEEVATDYDARIRTAREGEGLSQADLAQEINEKASLIRKLEHGDILPSDEVQKKLERRLDISLAEDAGEGDTEWESDASGSGLTLGDMVKRKD